MNSKFFKSHALVIICSLTSLNEISLHGATNKPAIHDSKEHALLEASIRDVFMKFDQSIDLFKELLSGLSPKSNEKLSALCKKLKTTIDEVNKLFIDPIRKEAEDLKGTPLEHSNYNKLLHTLLDICTELMNHFNALHNALSISLQDKPSALKVAKNIKPIIDEIISDINFKKIDALLAQAHKYALSYDITIEIKPHHRKIIDIADINPSKTYHLNLAQAFAVIREALEDLRKECRKPSAITQAETLRIIRSRL